MDPTMRAPSPVASTSASARAAFAASSSSSPVESPSTCARAAFAVSSPSSCGLPAPNQPRGVAWVRPKPPQNAITDAIMGMRSSMQDLVRIGALNENYATTGTYKFTERTSEPAKPFLMNAIKAVTENGEIFNLQFWNLDERCNLLRAVLASLMSFMGSYRTDIRDVACNGFLNLALKCPKLFHVSQGDGETQIIQDVVENLVEVMNALLEEQKTIVLRALESILSIGKESDCNSLIETLMATSNEVLTKLLRKELPFSLLELQQIETSLNFNLLASETLRTLYLRQRQLMGAAIADLYAKLCQKNGTERARGRRAPILRQTRVVRSTALNILNRWICDNNRAILDKFVPEWLTAMYGFHKRDLPHLAEIVGTLSQIIKRRELKTREIKHLAQQKIFSEIQRFIIKAARGYDVGNVDVRPFLNFFLLLVKNCLMSFCVQFGIDSQMFRLVMGCTFEAVRSTNGQIAVMGFKILDAILANPTIAGFRVSLYRKFYVAMLQILIDLLGNHDHCCFEWEGHGFHLYALVLARLLRLAGCGILLAILRIRKPTNVDARPSLGQTQTEAQAMYLRHEIKQLFSAKAELISDVRVSKTVNLLMLLCSWDVLKEFKIILWDYMLVHVKRQNDPDYHEDPRDLAALEETFSSARRLDPVRRQVRIHIKPEPMEFEQQASEGPEAMEDPDLVNL